MLSRSAHIIYLAAIVALAAVVVSPSIWQKPLNTAPLRSDAQSVESPNTDSGMSQFALLLETGAGGSAAPVRKPIARSRRTQESASDASASAPPATRPQPRNSSELVQRWLEVAGDIDPDLGKRLADLYEKNPAGFDSAMRHGNVGRNLNSMAILKHRDPELYQTKVTQMMQTVIVNRIAGQLRDAVRTNSAAQIEHLKGELKAALEHQLAHEIKAKGDYICRIEEQLEQAREELIEAAISFPHTIEARMAAHMKPRNASDGEIAGLEDEAASVIDDQGR